jgi:hypothetical protein
MKLQRSPRIPPAVVLKRAQIEPDQPLPAIVDGMLPHQRKNATIHFDQESGWIDVLWLDVEKSASSKKISPIVIGIILLLIALGISAALLALGVVGW